MRRAANAGDGGRTSRTIARDGPVGNMALQSNTRAAAKRRERSLHPHLDEIFFHGSLQIGESRMRSHLFHDMEESLPGWAQPEEPVVHGAGSLLRKFACAAAQSVVLGLHHFGV